MAIFTKRTYYDFRYKDIKILREYVAECDGILAYPDQPTSVDFSGFTPEQIKNHVDSLADLLNDRECHPLTDIWFNRCYENPLESFDDLNDHVETLYDALKDPYSDEWSDYVYESTVGYDCTLDNLETHLNAMYKLIDSIIEF